VDLSLHHASIEAPDRPALIAASVTLTYRDLVRRVAHAGARLTEYARAGAPVAFAATSDLDAAVLWHCLVALGIPALPLHPRLSPSERAALVSRVGATVSSGIDWDTPGRPPIFLPDVPDDDRTLAVLATSGTSGSARLAVLSRRALRASAEASARNLGWQPGDRWLVALPLAHVGGMAILVRCLLARQTAVLVPPGDTGAIVDALAKDDIVLLSLVPAQLERLLDVWPRREPPPRLRALLLGGDRVSPEVLDRARAWPVLVTYGLTETCSHVTCQPYGTRPHRDLGAGPPLPGVELRIVEKRVHVRGSQLFSGYWGESGPALDPEGWLVTGDLGRLDASGNLHVLGRTSDLIITAGENVHPAEVEALLESLPGVEAACVFGVKDSRFGELVAAALVPAGSSPPDDRAIVARLDAELATFKHPRRIAFVASLERAAGGKLDRARTAEKALGALRALRRPAAG
jgi:O-succinylbenzoic acid--CoA ligase